MSRKTANVVGCVVIGLFLVVAIPAVTFGPRLAREASAVIKPVSALVGSEETLGRMDDGVAFVPPEDGSISEDRLLVFLQIREELKRSYEPWQAFVNTMKGQQTSSWPEAKKALRLTAEVFETQVRTLREHGMSRAELVWLEDRVYRDWLGAIDAQPGDSGRPLVSHRLRERTREDLRFLAELEQRYGASPALAEMDRRLRARMAALDENRPEVAGMPAATQELLWRSRDRIRALDLSRCELHSRLRNGHAPAGPVGSRHGG